MKKIFTLLLMLVIFCSTTYCQTTTSVHYDDTPWFGRAGGMINKDFGIYLGNRWFLMYFKNTDPENIYFNALAIRIVGVNGHVNSVDVFEILEKYQSNINNNIYLMRINNIDLVGIESDFNNSKLALEPVAFLRDWPENRSLEISLLAPDLSEGNTEIHNGSILSQSPNVPIDVSNNTNTNYDFCVTRFEPRRTPIILGIGPINTINNTESYFNVSSIANWITSITGIHGLSEFDLFGYPAPVNFNVAENEIGHVKFTWEDLDPTIVDPNHDLQYVLYINNTQIEAIDPGEEEYDWDPIGFSDFTSPLTATLKVEDVMMNFPDGEEASVTFNLRTLPAPENFRIVANTYGAVTFEWEDIEIPNAYTADDINYHLEINGENIVIPYGGQTFVYRYSFSDIDFTLDKALIHAKIEDLPGEETQINLDLYAFPPVTDFGVSWTNSELGRLVLDWNDIDLSPFGIDVQTSFISYKLLANDQYVIDIEHGFENTAFEYTPDARANRMAFNIQLMVENENIVMLSEPALLNVFLPSYQLENLHVANSELGALTFSWENNEISLNSNPDYSYQVEIDGRTNSVASTSNTFTHTFDNFHDVLNNKGEISVSVVDDFGEIRTLPATISFNYPAIPSPVEFRSRNEILGKQIVFEWKYPNGFDSYADEIEFVLEIDGEKKYIPEKEHSYTYIFDSNIKTGLGDATLIAVAPNGVESIPETISFSYYVEFPAPSGFDFGYNPEVNPPLDISFTWNDVANNQDLEYKIQMLDAQEDHVIWEKSIGPGIQSATFSYDPQATRYWGPSVIKFWCEDRIGQVSEVILRTINLPLPSPQRFVKSELPNQTVDFFWEDLDPDWMSADQKSGLKYHIEILDWKATIDQDIKKLTYDLKTFECYQYSPVTAELWVEDPSMNAISKVETVNFNIPDKLTCSTFIRNLIIAGTGFLGLGVSVKAFTKGIFGYRFWPKAWKQQLINQKEVEIQQLRNTLRQHQQNRGPGFQGEDPVELEIRENIGAKMIKLNNLKKKCE